MDQMRTITLTDDNFEHQVIESNIPVLVDFWAEWCGPCKAVGPTIDALAEEFDGIVRVGKLNVDENAVANRYGIRSIPTVALFRNGEVAKQWIGVQSRQTYEEGVRRLL